MVAPLSNKDSLKGLLPSGTLLVTKTYIPHGRPNAVPRPRLIERLDVGVWSKLTLISAPAGFGKTTLLSQWRSTSAPNEGDLAWISLDEGDNDPTRFWAHFILALQTLEGSTGKDALFSLLLVQSPRPQPMELIITTLINEIAAFPNNFTLVLDDYHVITNQRIHDAITFLLDHLPPQMHLIITGRVDPPLPLARLRAKGQLTEVCASDLRFTSEETAAFLNKVMGLSLSQDDVEALEYRTEGWIVGLQFAALAMQGCDDIPSFVKSFTGSHHYVVDYVGEEVLYRQPEHVQAFLLETSILDGLNGSLCDAVTDGNDGQMMLERLDRANLFIIPLDDERCWYRYHHLFADFLRTRLQRMHPERVAELHRRASRWHRDNGFTTEAVGHALAIDDFQQAAGLIEEIGQPMLLGGETTTLQSWLGRLPDDLIRSRPRLCFIHACVFLTLGQSDAAEPYLQDAEANLLADAGEDLNTCASEIRWMLGEIAAMRSVVAALWQDIPRTLQLSNQALEYLPEDSPVWRRVVGISLAATYWRMGDIASASQRFGEAAVIKEGDNSDLLIDLITTGAQCFMADMQVIQGHLQQAARIYGRIMRLAKERGRQPFPLGSMAYTGMGELLYEWNDLEAAERHLIEGIELDKKGANLELWRPSYMNLARVRQAKGDTTGAIKTIREGEQLAHTDRVPLPNPLLAAYQAQLWLSQGNLAAATRWVQEQGLQYDDELTYQRRPEYVALARTLSADGQHSKAVELLERLREASESAGRMGEVIEVLVLQAVILQTQGNTARALTMLKKALSLAEPEGYVRTFVDEGEPMAALLSKLLRTRRKQRSDSSQGASTEYVRKLLSALQLEAMPQTSKGSPAALQQNSESLSGRELEVLRLLNAGLSDREIAKSLFITLNTVKTHIKSIYSKLMVHSRTQCIAKARGLNILR